MFKKISIILIAFMLFPIFVYASGELRVSSTSLNITRGGSSSFKVTAINAAGRVNISTSDGSVASISSSSEWLDNNVITITVRGLRVGTATITVTSSDMATYDREVINTTYTIRVNVSEPLGGNTSLKKLEVEGYELNQVSDNAYTLTVSNAKTNVNIIATPEDSKSTVIGTGDKELIVGQNVFEIIVRAENGTTKTYTITITRKDDKYYQEDIDDFIEYSRDILMVNIEEEISEETINKLKTIDKRITIAKVNENEEILYSYTIDTDKLNSGLITTASFESKYNVDEITNYTAGVTIVVDKDLPQNTEFKLKVDYNDGEELNLYRVKNGKIELIDQIKVVDGFVTFKIDDTEEYFITKANVNNGNVVNKNGSSIFLIIINILEGLVIVGLISFVVILLKKKNNDKALEKTINLANTMAIINTPDNVVISNSKSVRTNEEVKSEFADLDLLNDMPKMAKHDDTEE